jgi:hypothetical protein
MKIARIAIAAALVLASSPASANKWHPGPVKGTYWAWCDDCSPDVIGTDQNAWVVQVWCKKQDCGNIYVQGNLIKDDVVVGWTNATGYGYKGDKVNLTLSTYKDCDSITLTHMNMY